MGLRTISSSDMNAPVAIDQTAPIVLKRRHTIDSSSAGKFALAAIANARPTMNATFWPLNRMPSSTAATPNATVPMRATRTSSASLDFPPRHDVHEDVVRQRGRARQREARDDRENRRERDRRDEAEERRAAEQFRQERRGHVAARVDLPDHVAADQRRRRRSRRSG